jgi:Autographiviridae endonuclease
VSEHKFWAKVQKGEPTECWPWLGYKKPSGHGLTTMNSLSIHASRKAWILVNGPIRGDLCVNHTCDNAACCNPAHMYLGSRQDNMIDLWGKRPAGERGALGRPHVLDEAQLEQLWQMRKLGATMQECADAFGVHFRTVARYITTVRKAKLAELRKKSSNINALV